MAKGLSLPMDSHDLKRLSDGLLEDEAEVMLKLLSVREPKPIDGLADEVRGRRFCPSCGSAMWRNGTTTATKKGLPRMREDGPVRLPRARRVDQEIRRRLA